jgi:hypothetical protein
MTLTPSGNLGIANTSPQGLLQIGVNALSNNSDASNAFNLKQTSTTAATGIYLERSGERKGYYIYLGGSLDSLTFQRNNAGTKADVMSLTRDGNVGIGTDTPNEKLQVGGAISATGTATTAFASSSTMDYFSGGTRFISRGGNNSTRGQYTFKIESADGSLSINPLIISTTGAATFSSNSNSTISNTFQNTNTTNSSSRNYLDIIAGTNRISLYSLHSDNNYINTAYGDLYFQMNASTSTTNPMIIKASGNVGIGETNPTTKTHIVGSASTGGILRIENNQNQDDVNHGIINLVNTRTHAIGNDASIMFSAFSSDVSMHPRASIGMKVSSAGLAGDLVFNTRNDSNFAERMRITSTGTVQPGANGTQDLGTSSLRWATVFTSDLSLSNGIGDYTIVEGENDLFLYNNKQNKVYKFLVEEVDPSTATPKKS